MEGARGEARLPVHVLTGFLGSGKTTLLRHLLGDPGMGDTAVVINEFGEVGLDHLLVREVSEDVVLLASGCLCCTLRDDLITTLLELREAVERREIPAFGRIVVETTGLADPLPIVQAILSERRLARLFRLGRVIATVDAINGLATLDRYAEAVQQAAAADGLVLTKTDLAEVASTAQLEARLRGLNPMAQLMRSRPGDWPSAGELFRDDPGPPAARRIASVQDHGHAHAPVNAFVVVHDEPVDLDAFVDWLDLLLANRGEQVLRVKGYLAAIGHERPLVIQGVQHVVFRPEPLNEHPGAAGRSELVFITRDLAQEAIERSLATVFGRSTRVGNEVQLPSS